MDQKHIEVLKIIQGLQLGEVDDIESLNYLHANEYIVLLNAKQVEELTRNIEAGKQTSWEREEISKEIDKVERNIKFISDNLNSFGLMNVIKIAKDWRESNEFLLQCLIEQKEKLAARLHELEIIQEDARIDARNLDRLRPIGHGHFAKLTQLGLMLMDK